MSERKLTSYFIHSFFHKYSIGVRQCLDPNQGYIRLFKCLRFSILMSPMNVIFALQCCLHVGIYVSPRMSDYHLDMSNQITRASRLKVSVTAEESTSISVTIIK